MSIKKKKILAAVLATALVLSMMASIVVPVFAEDLDTLRQQEEEYQRQLEDAEALRNATQAEIDEAQEKIDRAMEELNDINEHIAEVGERIMALNNRIAENEAELELRKEELAQAQEDMRVYYKALKGRIRMMYESERSSYLDILFSAKSISDFFSRLEYISMMVEYDNRIMGELDAAKERIQVSKEAVEETQASLEADRKSEQKEQDNLTAQLIEKQNVIDEMESDKLVREMLREEQQAKVDKLSANLADTQEAIQNEEDRIAEEERIRQEQAAQGGYGDGNGGGGYYEGGYTGGGGDAGDRTLPNGYWRTWPGIGNGMLGWPCDCYILASLYGPRTHPITGEYKNHGGIDFSIDYGYPIYACESGQVIDMEVGGWGGGWGTYVMIKHNNGLSTLYAHCSSVTVSMGQQVSRGQVIAYVGSTGMSTGPHLHLEVYYGSTKVNPEDYL